MATVNWYSVRHHTKVLLITVTIVFFLYTVCNLFLVKQFYIKRYIELHLQSVQSPIPQHKSFQVDEELDFPSKLNLSSLHHNVTGQAKPNAQALQQGPVFTLDDDTQILDDSGLEDGEEDPSRVNIRYIFYIAVGVIVVIEVIYCLLYLYVISQKRFCPMLCFSILSLATFLLHIQRHMTIEQHASTDNTNDSKIIATNDHKSSSFLEHVDSLDSEALLNHITYSSWLEIGLSASETLLSIIFTVLLFYFPGRDRNRGMRGFLRLGSSSSRRALRPPPQQALNGVGAAGNGDLNHQQSNSHATAIELDYIDVDNVSHANQSDDQRNDVNDDESSSSRSSASPQSRASQSDQQQRQQTSPLQNANLPS